MVEFFVVSRWVGSRVKYVVVVVTKSWSVCKVGVETSSQCVVPVVSRKVVCVVKCRGCVCVKVCKVVKVTRCV